MSDQKAGGIESIEAVERTRQGEPRAIWHAPTMTRISLARTLNGGGVSNDMSAPSGTSS
jgi:hypothetical protein